MDTIRELRYLMLEIKLTKRSFAHSPQKTTDLTNALFHVKSQWTFNLKDGSAL